MRTFVLLISFLLFFRVGNCQSARDAWRAIAAEDSVIINTWLKRGMPVDTVFGQDRSMLHMAVLTEARNMSLWLLAKGASVNRQDADGMSPLHWAVAKSDLEVIQYFLNMSPNLRLVNRRGESLLHLATIHKRIDIVRILLKAGADKTIRDKYDLQPIDYAFDPDMRGLLWVEK